MHGAASLPRNRADRLASELYLDVGSAPVCLACLSIVAFALDSGRPREIQGRLVSITRDLWQEGLAEHALAAVEEARYRGVRDADAALRDLDRLGGRSPIARAITLRLARQLLERSRESERVTTVARKRLDSIRPDLN